MFDTVIGICYHSERSITLILPRMLVLLHCRWSQMLSHGSDLCKDISKDLQRNLRQNQLWFKRKAAADLEADSDEDDTEQFGICEGHDGGSPGVGDHAADSEDEDDVYPLYGEHDSDFGDSSSEVRQFGALLQDCSA